MRDYFVKVPELRVSTDDVPRRALEIRNMRPDIHDAFDLSAATGRRDLYWWYFLHGFREMWLTFNPGDDCKGPANAPVPQMPVHESIPITWLMRECWSRGLSPGSPSNHPKAQVRWPSVFRRIWREPTTLQRQRGLLTWYFCQGLEELNLLGLLSAEQADQLLAPTNPRSNLPSIVAMVHAMAPEMHACLPSADSPEWLDWCNSEGRKRFRILAHPLIANRLFPVNLAAQARNDSIHVPLQPGVNVIGHAGGRSGVSEDVRMAASALAAAKIPFVVRDVQPSSGLLSEDCSVQSHLSPHSPYQINLFCMAGMETVTLFGGKQHWLEGYVNIGFWPWELAEWPAIWNHAPLMMDELWASTEFTAQAYRHSTGARVQQVAMAVAVEGSDGLKRRDFGLPEDRFMFGFSFDGLSSFNRKNPAACIDAFRRAFPAGNEMVGLLLKGLRVDDSPQWRDLEMLAAADPRIILIAMSLPRGALLDLYRSIDAFVSLHRSEGFGRNIAECMLLGKPVIATNYSGNLDFTRPDTAALVNMTLRQVRAGEYPFGTGQVWADPSIDHAAQQMRRLVRNPRWRTQIAKAGQSFIAAHHAPAVVGEHFRSKFEAAMKLYKK